MKGKGLFITATGTDVGKTYVSGLIVKKLCEAGYSAGYYKAALSGADTIEDSDAGYVKNVSGISQSLESLVSYVYAPAVSPHLAAQLAGNPVNLEKVQRDYEHVQSQYGYVTVEGSGGIVCPIRWDDREKLLLEDIIKALKLPALVVADSGLGTINTTVLTTEYLKCRGIEIKGIIMNHFDGSAMHEDNRKMIEELTELPVAAVVGKGDENLEIEAKKLAALYL